MSNRAVLFVVYDFPPEGARGTKRSVKFVQQLSALGWAPVVLTARNQPFDFYDGSMVAEVPAAVPIYRALTLEGLVHRTRYKPDEVRDPVADAKQAPPPSILRGLFLRIYRGVGKFASVPDSRILWLPCAVASGLRIIRQHHCQAIYSSGPSHTNHFVAAILSRLTGLPLVTDFRDAWVGNPAPNANPRKGDARMERFCVRTADFVVSTTDGMRNDFARRYPDARAKFLTITNGFDPLDFPAARPAEQGAPGSVCRVVHAGTLGSERSPKEFLMALGQLLREKPELSEKLEVVFVGKSSRFKDGLTIEDYIKEYGCGRAVKIAGYVSRKASLEYMQQADALLLVIGRVPKAGAFIYGISGKIYDYAAARRPVLTIAEPGSSGEMAGHLKLGPVVHPDDTPSIKHALSALVQAHAAGELRCDLDLELLKSFEFSSLTARLADCLNKACAQKTNGRNAEPVRTSLVEGGHGDKACGGSARVEQV